MAQLLVRKLDEALVSTLRQRAAKNGHSMEEEHRMILREALTGNPSAKGELSLEQYLVSEPCTDFDIPVEPREYPPAQQEF